jgi:hypothetical protein
VSAYQKRKHYPFLSHFLEADIWGTPWIGERGGAPLSTGMKIYWAVFVAALTGYGLHYVFVKPTLPDPEKRYKTVKTKKKQRQQKKRPQE